MTSPQTEKRLEELRREQHRLIQEAAIRPGVEEAIRVYGRFAPYVPTRNSRRTVTRFATGGNG